MDLATISKQHTDQIKRRFGGERVNHKLWTVVVQNSRPQCIKYIIIPHTASCYCEQLTITKQTNIFI